MKLVVCQLQVPWVILLFLEITTITKLKSTELFSGWLIASNSIVFFLSSFEIIHEVKRSEVHAQDHRCLKRQETVKRKKENKTSQFWHDRPRYIPHFIVWWGDVSDREPTRWQNEQKPAGWLQHVLQNNE